MGPLGIVRTGQEVKDTLFLALSRNCQIRGEKWPTFELASERPKPFTLLRLDLGISKMASNTVRRVLGHPVPGHILTDVSRVPLSGNYPLSQGKN